MMRTFLVFIMILFAPALLRAQTVFRILEYNVENLFDLHHDKGHDDIEFLPQGSKKWNAYKYWKKQNSISKVIAAVGEDHLPDVIVLCEIENDTVIRDLCKRSPLRTLGYRSVQTSSKDKRGIDIAVLYQPGRFRMLQADTISIPSVSHGFKSTRDILHVQGRLITGDTLHVLACHLPSKYGGNRSSERHRVLAAQTLANLGDSILQHHRDHYLIVTGDFNADVQEPIFKNSLQKVSLWCVLPSHPLSAQQDVRGTYRYQGFWSSIDHFIVSRNMLTGRTRLQIKDSASVVANYPFLLERDNKYGGFKPFRTYQGPRYVGGYSDHLPLFLDILIRDDKVHY